MLPTLIYDGDCVFCTRWVNRIQATTGDRVRCSPYHEVAHEFPHIEEDAFTEAVHWVEPSGEIARGADAAFRFLSFAGVTGRLGRWAYDHLPGFAPVTEFGYRVIATNRERVSRVTRWLWGNTLEVPTYRKSANLFLRSLAAIYLVAFVSLWVQIHGLIGSNGILPLSDTMARVSEQLGSADFFRFPTFFWLSSSDLVLHLVCGFGVLLAAVAVIFPAFWPSWPLLWFGYLSLITVGEPFLSFQWDILLLEAGFLALFLIPISLSGFRSVPNPSRLLSWLFRWLLFRLMFASGIVKLTSGDSSWYDLTALTYHYETQPIPNLFSYYVHQLPEFVHTISVASMFFIELVVPFFFFAPRRLRHAACALTSLLQILIFLTGNYTFFNLLTLALCLWLIDDTHWGDQPEPVPTWRPLGKSPRRLLLFPVSALIILLSTIFLFSFSFRLPVSWPSPILAIYRAVSPFHLANTYGLFRVMTTERPEIILEGSHDGVNWEPYEFKYKVGDPSVAPPFVAPHQPRLDWQMWFAALSTRERTPWFIPFCVKLLKGSKDVLALLDHNPFHDRPPKYIRAEKHIYLFSTLAEKADTGNWWSRVYAGEYLGTISLK
jgi:predicted DCC family thiol-disulfide oxidoreductase YuxK